MKPPKRSTEQNGPTWTGLSLSPRARKVTMIGAVAVAAGLAVSIVAAMTPWPSAMLIRGVFEAGARNTVKEMLPYVPKTKLIEHPNVSYGDAGTDTMLDAFTPASATKPLPTVVWIHGGAWISGDKENVAPYLRILASHGYTTIGLNYTIGPEATYPTAVSQLNRALGYITEHAAELNVDPTQIVLAGDSAGSQLASQLAVLTTNPEYAQLMGMRPELREHQLVGTILNCGVYDLRRMSDLTGITAWGFKIALWGYTGTKNWSETYAGATMSTVDFVTDRFPPTYISGGNGDGLTWIETVPMSIALKNAGVDVDELLWPADHEPALPHEYQFHLDFTDAHTALQRTLDFLAEHTTR